MHTYKYHLKETINLAYPVSIGMLGHVMFGVVDSMMVGRVGAIPLAASSLVNGLVFLIIVFGLGMTLAITPLVAIAKGKNDTEQCGVILRQALLVNTVFSILLVVLTYFLANLIAFLNQPPKVAEQAISYAKILSFSIIPFIVFQSYRQFVEGLSYTRPPMYITIMANLVNVVGNWIFIFGNLGVPSYGLDGAGYSTIITRTFMAILMMAYVISSKRFKEFDPTFKFRNINWTVIKKLINLGIPSGFQHFFEVGAFAFAAVMIGWLGSKPLAAHQIALSMASVSFMIILGISASGTIRVGTAVGRESVQEVRDAGFSAVFLAIAIMACFGLIFISFRHQLPYLFISETEVITIAASLLIVAAFFQISDGVQAVGLGILRGITDVKIPTVIGFISYWIVGIPVGYLFGFILNVGVVGVWIGLLSGLTTATTFFTLRFNFKTKYALAE